MHVGSGYPDASLAYVNTETDAGAHFQPAMLLRMSSSASGIAAAFVPPA